MRMFIKKFCLIILTLFPTYLISIELKDDNKTPLPPLQTSNSNSNNNTEQNIDPEEKSQILVIGSENITDSENYFKN